MQHFKSFHFCILQSDSEHCSNVLGSKRYKAGLHRNTRPGLLDLYNVTQMVSQHVQFLFIANIRKQRGLFNFLKKQTNIHHIF